MRSFWTLVLVVALSGITSQATASIVEVLRYSLGEAGSFSGLVAQDSVGSRHMTVGFNFTAAAVVDTMNPSYSTNATAFGPTSSGIYGADSTGLPTDNFGVEIWARTSNVNQSFNTFFTLNGNTTGSLSFHSGDGTWSASYFGVDWVGPATGSGESATADEWTNLAVIRNNGTSTFYIDGVAQAGTTAAAPTYGNATAGIHLAITPLGATFFTGDLDEARVFTFDPNTDDPVAALSFNVINAIPEPASGWVLAIGAISLMSRRRRRA